MMYRLTAASLLLGLASAQTFTACNPLNKTCPADPALGTTLSLSDFTSAPSQFTPQSETISYSNGEAVFTINKEGDAPTLISNWYMFFGSVEVIMQAAPGQGIISSVVLESDDLDEIDLEWIGTNTAQVETNYFGKGDTSTYNRATYVSVSSPQTSYHNYTVNWTKESIQWIVDGSVMRTLNYADAAGGSRYPQTPMKLRIGSWAGGDPKNAPGTIQWAGGQTNYANGPYVMNVKSIKAIDASSGSQYVYGDQSGSWQSIKVVSGSGSSPAQSSGVNSAQGAENAAGTAAPVTATIPIVGTASGGSLYTSYSTSIGYSTSLSTSCVSTSYQTTMYTPGANPSPGIGYQANSTAPAASAATPTPSASTTGPSAAKGAASALSASTGSVALVGAALLAVMCAL